MAQTHTSQVLLPLELLQQIFEQLAFISSSPFDLLAASLVCSQWYFIARPLFNENQLRHLVYDRQCTAELLEEAKRINVDYVDIIESVAIDANILFAYSGNPHTTTEIILHSFLKYLSIIKPRSLRKIIIKPPFYRKYEIIIDAITYSAEAPPLTAAFGSLNHPYVHRLSLLAPLEMILSRFVISLLKDLGAVTIDVYDESPLENMMIKALAGSFSNLESFSFVGESWQCGNGIQSVNTLEHVVSQCPRLKTLSLTRYWGVNSDFMEWLLRDAVELESLTLEEVYVKDGLSWCSHGKGLKKLVKLELEECRGISPDFLAGIMGWCPLLKIITLPRHLDLDSDVRLMMMRKNFEPRQSLVTPTQAGRSVRLWDNIKTKLLRRLC